MSPRTLSHPRLVLSPVNNSRLDINITLPQSHLQSHITLLPSRYSFGFAAVMRPNRAPVMSTTVSPAPLILTAATLDSSRGQVMRWRLHNCSTVALAFPYNAAETALLCRTNCREPTKSLTGSIDDLLFPSTPATFPAAADEGGAGRQGFSSAITSTFPNSGAVLSVSCFLYRHQFSKTPAG